MTDSRKTTEWVIGSSATAFNDPERRHYMLGMIEDRLEAMAADVIAMDGERAVPLDAITVTICVKGRCRPGSTAEAIQKIREEEARTGEKQYVLYQGRMHEAAMLMGMLGFAHSKGFMDPKARGEA